LNFSFWRIAWIFRQISRENREITLKKIRCSLEHLIDHILSFFIKEQRQIIMTETSDDRIEHFTNFTELTESLIICISKNLADKIAELMNRFAWRIRYAMSFMHDCITTNRVEKYYELAIYNMVPQRLCRNKSRWNQVSIHFLFKC